MGIYNVTVVTMHNLTSIMNVSEPVGFLRNVNGVVYGGILFYLLLWVLLLVLFWGAYEKRDEFLINGMYSSAVVTVIGLFFFVLGLINGFQWGSFALISVVLALVVWFTKAK